MTGRVCAALAFEFVPFTYEYALLVHDILPAVEIIHSTVRETKEALQRGTVLLK